jgi:DNA-binding NarL/FixJ family response regulator
MVVDDQLLVGEVLAQSVSAHQSFSVALVTCDALQALSAAERLRPAIVVIDATMPHAFRAARALAAHASRTRVLLLDDFPSEDQARRALGCGASGYLTKREPLDDFATALAHIAAGGQAFPKQPAAKQDHKQNSSFRRVAGVDEPSPAILTLRELEVLTHLARGLRVRECARALGISHNTVENHKARIMGKLGIHKTVELTRFAIHHGIVSAS